MANTNLEHFLQHKCTLAIPEHVRKMNHPFRNMYLSATFLEHIWWYKNISTKITQKGNVGNQEVVLLQWPMQTPVVQHFAANSTLDECNESLPTCPTRVNINISTIIITPQKVGENQPRAGYFQSYWRRSYPCNCPKNVLATIVRSVQISAFFP